MDRMQRLDAVLGEVELFSSLDQKSLALLREKMKPVSLKTGDVLCTEGETGDRMFVLSSGELRVLKQGKSGKPIEITRLKPGEVAGVMSLFEAEPRSATLEATGDAEVWEIDQTTFQHLLDTQPAISRAMLAVMSRYLREETKIVAELSSHDEDHRLKVAVFDTKPYTKKIFCELNRDRFALRFFDSRLNVDTVALAKGFKVICAFVNDQIDAGVIEELRKSGVELVAMRCAGYNNVDLKTCEENSISVARVPAYSPYAVAEHAVALMMALNRHIHTAHNRVREGNFALNGLVGFDMHEKTVGVIGTGKIGKCLISILIGFGCRVLTYDKFPDKALEKEPAVQYVELDELLKRSAIISLHAPLTPETHHIINDKSIQKMKPGVMLINTSRGGLVDTHALIGGLLSGQIGSAGLDVYEEESGYFFEDFSDTVIVDEVLARLTTFNNVMVTSHMAFLTREALSNITETTFTNIEEFQNGKRGGELANAVTFKKI